MRELIIYMYKMVVLVKTACALCIIGIGKSSFLSLEFIKTKIKWKHVFKTIFCNYSFSLTLPIRGRACTFMETCSSRFCINMNTNI